MKPKRCVCCGADVWSSHPDRLICDSKVCLRLVAEVSMKEVDDTPVGESDESDDAVYRWLTNLEARIVDLEQELALLLEQRETVRAPECQEDPEWYA